MFGYDTSLLLALHNFTLHSLASACIEWLVKGYVLLDVWKEGKD